MRRWLYSLCYRWSMVDSYLAMHRNEMQEAAEHFSRAEYWKGQIDLLDLNRRFSHG